MVNRTELTSLEHGNRDGKPRNVSQRQYFQNLVLILVLGSREQIHDAFDVIKLERMQEVMFVVSQKREEEEHLLQQYRWRRAPSCAKIPKNVAVDDFMEITISRLGAAAEKNV